MPVKFNLFSCKPSIYPDIYQVLNPNLTPHVDRKIILDNDASKVYTVGLFGAAGYFDFEVDSTIGSTTYNVTSIKFNGVEQLTSTQTVVIPNNTNPELYHEYYSFRIAWAPELTDVVPSGAYETVPSCGFYQFLKNLIEVDLALLNVTVGKASNGFFTNYMQNLFGENEPQNEFYRGILIEKDYGDSIEITYNYNDDTTDPGSEHVEFNDLPIKYVFDEENNAYMTVDGNVYPDNITKLQSWNDLAFIPHSGLGDFLFSEITGVESCDLQVTSFNTDVEFDCVTCETECDALSFTDTSTINNTFPGHQVFGYRLIRLIRPDGTVYEYSSASSDDPDQLIGVLSNGGINTFSYSFLDTDTDGVWSVQVYNFPEWDEDVLYNHLLGIIVHKGDKIYQCIQSNVGVDPETDVDGAYWVEYAITEDTLNTRYGSVAFKAVLCISSIGCYKKLIEDAFCSEKSDPCSNLCDNQKFQNAMKIRVVWDAIKSSSCRNDWNEVKNQIDIWKNLCNCVNC